jgi:hypothetical protein
MSDYIRDVVSRLVNVSNDNTSRVYIMSEDRTTLVPINTLNIFVDSDNRVIIAPTDRKCWSMLDAVKLG